MAGRVVVSLCVVNFFLVRVMGLEIKPLPRFSLTELSPEDFDIRFKDKLPVILTGFSTCPQGLSFSNFNKSCQGIVRGHKIHHKSNKSFWAGLEKGDRDMEINEFIRSMGDGSELRFLFDVPFFSLCPTVMRDISIPAHFDKIFARMWRWSHMKDTDNAKCMAMPFYNMYMAEGGFQSDFHLDAKHTSFTASMCVGRKRWRIMSNLDFYKNRHVLEADGAGGIRTKNGYVLGNFKTQLDTWSENSPLHQLEGVLYEGLLEPGDTIYIPGGAPHAAETLDQSFMVASNDQTLGEIKDLEEGCEVIEGHILNATINNASWTKGENLSEVVQLRQRQLKSCYDGHVYRTVEQNHATYGARPRRARPFLDAYGCEKVVADAMEGFSFSDESVVEFTTDNFEAEISKGPIVVVKTKMNCLICTRLKSMMPAIAKKFSPGLRWGFLDCTMGCPNIPGPLYGQVLSMHGHFPELVLVKPSSKKHTYALSRNESVELPYTFTVYFGDRVRDWFIVWASFHSGVHVTVEPLWWNATLYVLHCAIWCMVLLLQVLNVAPTIDGPPQVNFKGSYYIRKVLVDGGTIALAGIVIGAVFVLLFAIACCCRKRRATEDEKLHQA